MWHTKALPEYKIPSLRFSDGPNGIRGTKFFNGVPSACFPCGTALGATFNTVLLEEAGRLMAREAIAKNVHVALGPTVNIQRSPLGGRGFESLSEDPLVSGLGAAALIRGLQSEGVQATIKHFVCNDQEHKRNNSQSIVRERALREIYAMPFQIAVRDSQPAAFMTGYNGVNGTFCSEDPKLLDELLRKEWGWDGLVMSDWYGTYSTTPAVVAGLDLEMPGPPLFRGPPLRVNAASGKIPEHVLNERVRKVLELVKKCTSTTHFQENGPEATVDKPETAALLRKIGNESIVLLKNDGNILPLKRNLSTLVLGPNAKMATICGGGSAALTSYYSVNPLRAINQKLSSPATYTIGAYTHKLLPILGPQVYSPNGIPGMRWRVFNDPPGTADRRWIEELFFQNTEILLMDYYNDKVAPLWYADLEGSFVAEEDGLYELGLVVRGTAKLFVDGELVVDNATKQFPGDTFFGKSTREERGRVTVRKGQTYNIKVEFASAPSFTLKVDGNTSGHGAIRIGGCPVIDDQAEIKKAVALAKEHDQVIICAGLNADWETEGVDRESMILPGCLNQLISEVAAANPRCVVSMQTGTPEEMPWLDQVPAVIQAWYGGNETGNSIADVLFGDYNPSGKLSLSFPKRLQDVPSFLNFGDESGCVIYGEGIYVGYRFYEIAQRKVNFPFGHGLSYTSFAFSNPTVSGHDGRLSASLKVRNVGSVRGAEVVQMYVHPPKETRIRRPIKELKGYAKIELDPDEEKEVTIQVQEKYAVSYFDEEQKKWFAQAGTYEIILTDCSAAPEGKTVRGSYTVKESYWWSGI